MELSKKFLNDITKFYVDLDGVELEDAERLLKIAYYEGQLDTFLQFSNCINNYDNLISDIQQRIDTLINEKP